MLIAERRIIARLRDRRFYSLAEANAAIRACVAEINARPFQKLDGSRQSLFEQLDHPALRPLPAARYEFATWRTARVNIQYHVAADKHYYSVPYQLARQQVDVRLSAATVEIFCSSKRVASHPRSHQRHGHTTDPAHMPEAHRQHAQWTPQRITGWAGNTGPAAAGLVAKILESRPHPEQGYRAALGIIRLAGRYGPRRAEAACARALRLRLYSYRSVESILRTGLDRAQILDLAQARWAQHRRAIVITGPGTGKTYLACALAHAAIRNGHTAFYQRAPQMLDELAIACGDGRLARLLAAWARISVLVIDDPLLRPLTPDQAADLLEVIEDRAGLRHHRHQPAARRDVAPGHRRPHHRRRRTRQAARQRRPHHLVRRVHAPHRPRHRPGTRHQPCCRVRKAGPLMTPMVQPPELLEARDQPGL